MASKKRRGLPLLGVLIVAVVLVVVATVLIEGTLVSRGSEVMRKNVDKYWSAKQHSWPAEYRSNNQKKLPTSLKASMRAARKGAARAGVVYEGLKVA